jgi:hypothetical protein
MKEQNKYLILKKMIMLFIHQIKLKRNFKEIIKKIIMDKSVKIKIWKNKI